LHVLNRRPPQIGAGGVQGVQEAGPDPPVGALSVGGDAMMYFINGLQWSGYKNFEWGVVGESACADSWGRALKTRQPSLSISSSSTPP